MRQLPSCCSGYAWRSFSYFYPLANTIMVLEISHDQFHVMLYDNDCYSLALQLQNKCGKL